jgi:hypothetical protein
LSVASARTWRRKAARRAEGSVRPSRPAMALSAARSSALSQPHLGLPVTNVGAPSGLPWRRSAHCDCHCILPARRRGRRPGCADRLLGGQRRRYLPGPGRARTTIRVLDLWSTEILICAESARAGANVHQANARKKPHRERTESGATQPSRGRIGTIRTFACRVTERDGMPRRGRASNRRYARQCCMTARSVVRAGLGDLRGRGGPRTPSSAEKSACQYRGMMSTPPGPGLGPVRLTAQRRWC